MSSFGQTAGERFRSLLRDRIKSSGLSERRFEDKIGVNQWSLRGILDKKRNQTPNLDKAEEILTKLGLGLYFDPNADGMGSLAPPGSVSHISLERLRRSIELVESGLKVKRKTLSPAKKAELVTEVYDYLNVVHQARSVADALTRARRLASGVGSASLAKKVGDR